MKRFMILAFVLVLTAAMLTGCRNDKGNNTTAATKPPMTRPATAPTTAPTTTPRTTQRPTAPENTTIGPDGTVGTEGGNSATDGPMTTDGTNGNGSDPTGDMAGRARGAMRNAARSFRKF